MRVFAALLCILALTACTTSRDTQPQRSATEQLLISAAADRAAENLAFHIPADTKVYVDAGNFEGYDGKYAVGAIKDRLLKRGAKLVTERAVADMIVEPRAGALSIDEDKSLFGIPSFTLPIPLTGPLNTPEIALFKKHQFRGVAKFATTGYDARTGALIDSQDPTLGYAHKTEWVVLLFISWKTDDLTPKRKEWWSIGYP